MISVLSYLTLFVFTTLVFGDSLIATEIVAHRGASHDAPENTLSSVLLAWDRGADMVEVDVHLTKDNEIVIIHDEDTKRTAGVKMKVAESTLAQLRTLDVGSWKGKQYVKERIPTLLSILKTIPKGKRLVIEIKCQGTIVERLEEVLRTSKVAPEKIVVISFDYDVIKRFKGRNEGITVLWLKKISRDRETGNWEAAEKLISKAFEGGFDGLNVAAGEAIDGSYVRRVHEAGLEFFVYTVDDPYVAKQLSYFGIDGVTTNRPALLQECLTK